MRVSPASLEDALLVDRCLDGEERAARELFRREVGHVHATLARLLGQDRDLDDLVQETFVAVFAALKRYRQEARLSTYINRITVRVAYRELRERTRGRAREARVPLDLVLETAGQNAAVDQAVQAREGIRRLYAALESLSPLVRLAWVLHELEGKPVKDVAELSGASVTAVKVRIWRARRAIRQAAQADVVLAELLGDAGEEEI